MIDISITDILTNVKNFPGNGKFQNPKFPAPTSREETLYGTMHNTKLFQQKQFYAYLSLSLKLPTNEVVFLSFCAACWLLFAAGVPSREELYVCRKTNFCAILIFCLFTQISQRSWPKLTAYLHYRYDACISLFCYTRTT